MHNSFRFLFLVFLAVRVGAAEAANLILPEEGSEWKITWGQEPEVAVTATRGEMVLNGLWAFQPTKESSEADEEADWGLIQVPGSWKESWSQPRLITRGTGGVWEGYDRGHDTWRAWYRRPFFVPAHWEGRRILLDLPRVSTDAEVFLDEQKAGEVHWPGGVVDLTEWAKPGVRQDLSIRVMAIERNEMVSTMMGTEEGHNRMVRQRLETYGIIGDVVLRSEPLQTPVANLRFTSRVSDGAFDLVWEQETEERLRVEVEFAGPDGEVEKRFTHKRVRPSAGQVALRWDWEDPRLWDVGKPELYDLRLKVYEGKTLLDEIHRRVAFREFEIRGKDFYLNGSLIRLRPNSSHVYYKGIRELNEGMIEGFMATGHNLLHYWPNDPLKRGSVIDYDQVASIADEKGMLLSLPLPAFYDLVKTDEPDEDTIAKWKQTVAWTIRSLGHHPSVVIWGSSPNFFGHGDDQNPRRIGRDDTPVPSDDWTDKAVRAEKWISWINEQDPTRSVLIHQGAAVGEIYATNNYLCLLPLQEREEWLSHWAEQGTKPYMGVEFGPPLEASFTRGRNNGSNAGASEPLLVEHAAAWLGPEAYRSENADYRKKLEELQAMGVRKPDWHGNAFLNEEALYQEVLDLFLRRTGRSWRTWGQSGGNVYWNIGRSLFPNDWRGGNYDGWLRVEKPAFEPGRRGAYFWRSGLPLAFTDFWRNTEATRYQPAAETFLEINADTMAYIGGGADTHWVDKTHQFRSGSLLRKQVVMVNDSRNPVRFEGRVTVNVNGQEIRSDEIVEALAVGDIRALPFEISLPEVEAVTDGEIVLSLKQGDRELRDRFAFRIYPEASKVEVKQTAWIFEQDGSASALLASAGVEGRLAEELPEEGILVLGRNTFDQMPWTWAELAEWVKQGNRLLIMGQSPKQVEQQTDLRASRYVSRRFWPVESVQDHPLIAGLDEIDFRDWPGQGTLLPQEAHTGFDRPVRTTPLYGWRWGTRGSVASTAWEIPHHSAWKPLLQGEFDLSYSPLMTLELGRGHVLFCGLDLEERGAENPVGDEMLRRMLGWLDTVKDAEPARNSRITGSFDFLKAVAGMGVLTGPNPRLWIVGPGAPVQSEALDAFLQSGGNVLRLDLAGAPGIWSGAQQLPDWLELDGVRLGDLRPRLDTEVGLLDGGLFARRERGEGVEISFQLRPELFEGQPYQRYSRWNATRALGRLIANLGGGFERDLKLLQPEVNPFDPIVLPTEWRHGIEKRLPPVASLDNVPKDEGNTKLEAGWHKPDFDDSAWPVYKVLGGWENHVESLKDFDGAMWLRVSFKIPAEWNGKGDAILELERVDDYDITYVNGYRVGKTGAEVANAWNVPRVYPVKSWMLKPGERNVIAIRIFDHFRGGGLTVTDPLLYRLRLKEAPQRAGLYHADYRPDRAEGDNPFRYYRW